MAESFDAIVIGSGISGGWAAKELCEKGLKTLLLERGRMIEHPKDYTTATLEKWELPHRGEGTVKEKMDSPVQSTIYAWGEASKQYFVIDKEHPYIQKKPFGWIRSYQLGGRSLVWGRQSYRIGDIDFEANAKDGHGVDWPIRYKDIAPWYSYVEKFAGISGAKENLFQLPDGEFQPAMEMNVVEKEVKKRLEKEYPDRKFIMGRIANLTKEIGHRQRCQYRNRCHLGCPFGAYFSSNSSTLPAAIATGNLTIRPFSIAMEILYDKDKRKAIGVRITDSQTKEIKEYFARIIFLNASTVASAAILLNSRSDVFPHGMGNNYAQVGHNFINHHVGAGASGTIDGFEDKYYYGRRANGPYLPRFRNIGEKTDHGFLRGYGFQCNAEREGFGRSNDEFGIGVSLKDNLSEPGKWIMSYGGFGEVLPYYDNMISLHPEQKDQWGMPLVVIDAEIKDNEKKMRTDMVNSAAEMLERTGFKNIKTYDRALEPNARVLSVHEMGTARMGRDPKTSVLNAWNQLHDVPNVFVTDGSCMTSSACQNPSLTYMALTARACDFAVSELKKRNL
ncbi:MAG: GMC family oxidoreductase [Citrobacter freundii]|nr:MAG: GMC family oxidoreductase [Citrobacter freundii]